MVRTENEWPESETEYHLPEPPPLGVACSRCGGYGLVEVGIGYGPSEEAVCPCILERLASLEDEVGRLTGVRPC